MNRLPDGRPAPRRQQLVHLTSVAWRALQAAADGRAVREGLALWARQDWPLVVAQQAVCTPTAPTATTALGLPLPAPGGCQRLRLQVDTAQLSRVAAFPAAEDVVALLPHGDRPAMRGLLQDLAALGVRAQAYGSYGWQCLTGLHYVHDGSDLDLLLPVVDAAMADHAAACLGGFTRASPRLDGELLFGDGTAVAWREWRAWRGGRSLQILLKRTGGACLASGTGWLDPAERGVCGVRA